LDLSDLLRKAEYNLRNGPADMREFFARYFNKERHDNKRAAAALARVEAERRQNMKSEFEHVATIPLRTFMRAYRDDKDFFLDDNNLRSLKRDNPEFEKLISIYGSSVRPTWSKKYPTGKEAHA